MGAALDTAEWVEDETIWDLWRKLRELAAAEGADQSRVVSIWIARLDAKYGDRNVVPTVRESIGAVLDQFRSWHARCRLA